MRILIKELHWLIFNLDLKGSPVFENFERDENFWETAKKQYSQNEF